MAQRPISIASRAIRGALGVFLGVQVRSFPLKQWVWSYLPMLTSQKLGRFKRFLHNACLCSRVVPVLYYIGYPVVTGGRPSLLVYYSGWLLGLLLHCCKPRMHSSVTRCATYASLRAAHDHRTQQQHAPAAHRQEAACAGVGRRASHPRLSMVASFGVAWEGDTQPSFALRDDLLLRPSSDWLIWPNCITTSPLPVLQAVHNITCICVYYILR